MNLLAFLGLIVLISQRKKITKYKYIIGLSMAIATLFLSNPFLGLEWASRLFMSAYIPVTVLYIVIYNFSKNNWLKIPTISIFLMLLFISFGASIFDKPSMTMDKKSFMELQQMKGEKLFLKSDAIVARQSLRILSNWVFNVKGIDKYLLTKEQFNKYATIYLLKQLKGKNPFERGGEPSLGDTMLSIYKGEHFEVFKLTSDSKLPVKSEKIFKGIKGTIQKIEGNKLSIIDIRTNKIRTIYYDLNRENFAKLKFGMKVEVNGEWLPFSIDIKAETIKEIDKPIKNN
jgi:hypothetical protein